ncbi:magnesium transporter CorA family protein [Aurantimonas sp. VKM B-3413]|uniref:magnesium transporter CorA family protein n=1 Tax=Aurantimonas sp. VKM B-3413 TaxID=2779401 RepID=UPI001E43156D|nr:magnesium transporter CorA family protein [Aurantimonas sp. VKM B-3413]MCB8838830.1 magnesium transporter CorA family protein [Aurantimonas sp. VKM B-3413]
MIEAYEPEGVRARRRKVAPGDIPETAIWLDLLDPSVEEVAAIEALCGIDVPTREEMREIEVSSRLYSEDGADFMTAAVVYGLDSGKPSFAPVTFILVHGRLITLRYSEPKSFAIFSAKLCRDTASVARANGNGGVTPPPLGPAINASEERPTNAQAILIGLLETVIDRVADLLEAISADLDRIGDDVFNSSKQKRPTETDDFKSLLRRIGAAGDLTSRVRESLATIDRLLPFMQLVLDRRKPTKDAKLRVKAMIRDVHSLNDFVSFLSNKTTFLLDTTVGMISIEQNAIIKIFSVAAVAFLPPTLIASIYGMNFKDMPELNWAYGYPYALVLMVFSAIVPLIFFRYKHWL